jgi:hypothetical protein
MKKKSRKRYPSIKKKSRKRYPSIKKKSRKPRSKKSRKRRSRKYDKGLSDYITKIGSTIIAYTPDSIKNSVLKSIENTPDIIKNSVLKRAPNSHYLYYLLNTKIPNQRGLKSIENTKSPNRDLPIDIISEILKYGLNDCNFDEGNIQESLFAVTGGLIDGKTERTPEQKEDILTILNTINNKDEILKANFILRSLKNLIKHDVTKESYIKILILLSFNEEITIENLTDVFKINKINNMYNYRGKYFCLFNDVYYLNPVIQVPDLVILNIAKKDTIKTKHDWFYENINCENLSFYGFSCVKTIEDSFLLRAKMRNVTFENFNNLQKVGNKWMRHCHALVSPDFTGLKNLQKISDYCMSFCESLVSPKFIGLENLKYVGADWMKGCESLESPNFRGLENLENVGSGWMVYCLSLVSPNFTGLENLKYVGASWMFRCLYLVSPNFTGLKNLKEVSFEWMEECSSLESPDFTGLENLQKVGKNWMRSCPRTLNSYRVNTSFHAEKIGDKFELVAN